MSEKRIESFEEFWPFYVHEHSKKSTRIMHFVGTTAAAGTAIAALVLKRPSLILVGLALGYGPAWISHFFIEKNRPASFKYPLWSFKADWIMWSKIIAGTMDAEVERVMASNGAEGTTEEHTAPATTNGTTVH